MKKRINVPVLRDLMQEDNKIMDRPEIRVWYHPHKIGLKGDDFFKTFSTVKEAKEFIKKNKEAAEDTPLFAFNGYEYDLLGTEIVELKK